MEITLADFREKFKHTGFLDDLRDLRNDFEGNKYNFDFVMACLLGGVNESTPYGKAYVSVVKNTSTWSSNIGRAIEPRRRTIPPDFNLQLSKKSPATTLHQIKNELKNLIIKQDSQIYEIRNIEDIYKAFDFIISFSTDKNLTYNQHNPPIWDDNKIWDDNEIWNDSESGTKTKGTNTESPTENDLLERTNLIKTITEIICQTGEDEEIENKQNPNNQKQKIGLFSDWGSGKTSFIKQIKREIYEKNSKSLFIEIDARLCECREQMWGVIVRNLYEDYLKWCVGQDKHDKEEQKIKTKKQKIQDIKERFFKNTHIFKIILLPILIAIFAHWIFNISDFFKKC